MHFIYEQQASKRSQTQKKKRKCFRVGGGWRLGGLEWNTWIYDQRDRFFLAFSSLLSLSLSLSLYYFSLEEWIEYECFTLEEMRGKDACARARARTHTHTHTLARAHARIHTHTPPTTTSQQQQYNTTSRRNNCGRVVRASRKLKQVLCGIWVCSPCIELSVRVGSTGRKAE